MGQRDSNIDHSGFGGGIEKRRSRQRLCRDCGQRPPRFRYRGKVKARRDHDLCPACHRALMNRAWARAQPRRLVAVWVT